MIPDGRIAETLIPNLSQDPFYQCMAYKSQKPAAARSANTMLGGARKTACNHTKLAMTCTGPRLVFPLNVPDVSVCEIDVASLECCPTATSNQHEKRQLASKAARSYRCRCCRAQLVSSRHRRRRSRGHRSPQRQFPGPPTASHRRRVTFAGGTSHGGGRSSNSIIGLSGPDSQQRGSLASATDHAHIHACMRISSHPFLLIPLPPPHHPRPQIAATESNRKM
ncbi:hypothetical protein JOL62DRAFT_77098 [Phyllosticta paracitricarpa]|uniref:Uncharacterized protein n=1 Tax=Phyllosticta paracitricarpa TaxID=2016321 RepID=A0ABR1NA82_9PEZI